LKDIVWPVYRLGEKKPSVKDGITFYQAEYADIDTATSKVNIRIVDDKSINKPTLGLRRLFIDKQLSLFPIGSAVYFLVDLIKLAKSTTWFIDSHGKVFQHKKIKRAKLQTHKITKVLPAGGVGCVLEVEGLVFRFKSMKAPESWEQYAGILYADGGHMLYGYYEYPIKDSWRLI
jgi:hypothetical protein